jgi:hypothetical protein
MKRHTRPYGCTFVNCWKRFGSRNDWKRHENSQHYMQEMWRCGLLGASDAKCGKVYWNEDTFRSHLTRKHTQTLQNELGLPIDFGKEQVPAEFTRKMHLGCEGHEHFWCGFCGELIAQILGTHNAWEQRFKHIGDHFDAGWHIDKWVCVEANKQKQYITREDKKEARRRLRTGVLDDDSDLGDSGIVDPPLPSVPRFTGPVLFPFPVGVGHGPVMPPPGGVAYTLSNKRRRIEDPHDDDGDDDADGVSDDETAM